MQHRPDDINTSGPHFLGIGAARSGTTWLAKCLDSAHCVWIPKRKELHYFSRDKRYPSPSFLSEPTFWARFARNGMSSARFRRSLLRAAAANIVKPSRAQLQWDLKFFLGRNDKPGWYPSLFPKTPGVLTGEITPAYGLLDDDDVDRVARAYPHLKILYIIRNPVDRAWSTLSYHFKRGQVDLETMSENEIYDYLTRSAIERRSDYVNVIDRWRSRFGEGNFLLAFYDEIREDPVLLARKTEDFLGVPRDSLVVPDRNVRINKSSDKGIPPSIRSKLISYHSDNLEVLAESLGGYAKTWLEDSRA